MNTEKYKTEIRKMQTAAGGRLRFTPEQIEYFESQATRIPGMNNSGGNGYREKGVQALLYQELEKKRKEEEIKSRMEMRPTLKRKATFSEKLRGKKDKYVQTPQVVGMSGADPLLSFYVGGVGLNGIGALAKTGLWNVAKYVPTTQLGNWGRLYFVGNTFKNSLNGSVPTLTSQATSLLYQPAKLNESGLTSLKFFERPTLSNAQELAGATRWERNFKPKWHVANYPGYLLKGLMQGSLLERLLSKNGTININLLNAYFNKASQIEKEVVNKVLSEKFAGLKTINYNLFKKAVLDELIGNYNRVPLTQYADYGMARLGFNFIDPYGSLESKIPILNSRFPGRFVKVPDKFYADKYLDTQSGKYITSTFDIEPLLKDINPNLNTFTFESPRLPIGNNKHYDTSTLGHSRTYTLPEEPNVLHVLESQSDWGQSHVKMIPSVWAHQIAIEKALKSGNTSAFHSLTNRFGSLLRDKLTKYERMALENINKEIESGLPSGFLTIEDLWNKKYEILKKAGNRSNIGVLGLHLHDNYLQRQLQENLRYAAENGLTKMRYPTSGTAAKIEGYLKKALPRPTRDQEIELRDLIDKMWKEYFDANEAELRNIPYPEMESIGRKNIPKFSEMLDKLDLLRSIPTKFDYIPEHQTILKKYADFPKLFLKLYKGQNVRTVSDAKGNTWYEVDVPKGYLSREWQFKQGGKINVLELFKKGHKIHIKKENRGKFTDYCGGQVTSACILRGKNSSNPAVRKRATFAANARKWKHLQGGIIEGAYTLYNGLPIRTVNLPEVTITGNKFKYLNTKSEKEKNNFFRPFAKFIFGSYSAPKDSYFNATIPYGLGPGHERDNIIQIHSGKSGEMDRLGMYGAIKGKDGRYRFKNPNYKPSQDPEYQRLKSDLGFDSSSDNEFLKWCAENGNRLNLALGLPTTGNAWTRHGVFGDSLIIQSPEKKEDYWFGSNRLKAKRLARSQGDYVSKNIDKHELKTGDIVDMYYKGSDFLDRAFREGDNNRTNSHTGTILRTGRDKEHTYVVHSTGNGFNILPIGELLSPGFLSKSYITGIRRPGTKKHPYKK